MEQICGKPNWKPLEQVLTREECSTFMYMGCVGTIEIYKHYFTRRYLNIDSESGEFYLYANGSYRKVDRAAALAHVWG